MGKKMAVLTRFIIFYITCLSVVKEFVICSDYGESGQEITLNPNIQGKPLGILWKHNGNIILEYDEREVVEYGSFKGRVVLDFETGELTIRKLHIQDSGQYQSEIWINGKVQYSQHNLTVLDLLPEPKVTCEPDDTLNLKTLLCSVESWTQPIYEWNGPNIFGHQGPELLVDTQGEQLDSVYTCIVKNKVNSKSTDYTMKDCHTGRSRALVLAPVLTISLFVIAFLLILLALYCIRHKNEKSRRSGLNKMDTEIGEHHNLLTNLSTEVIPGSSDATLPCHTRLTSLKESIAVRSWDHIQIHQDNVSKNIVEIDEETHVKENNGLQKEDLNRLERFGKDNNADLLKDRKIIYHTGEHRTENEVQEPDRSKNSPRALEEDIKISKPVETDREMKERPLQSQDECSDIRVNQDLVMQESGFDQAKREKEKQGSQVLDEKNEWDKESLEQHNMRKQDTEAMTHNEEEQTAKEIKEREEDQRTQVENHGDEPLNSFLDEPSDAPAENLPELSVNLEMEPTCAKDGRINSLRTTLSNVSPKISSNDDNTSSGRSVDVNLDKESEGEEVQGLEMEENEKDVTNGELRGQEEQTPVEESHVPIISESKSVNDFEKQDDHQNNPDSTMNIVSEQQGHTDGLSEQSSGISYEEEQSFLWRSNMRDDEQETEPIDDNQKIMHNEQRTEVDFKIIGDGGEDEKLLPQQDDDDIGQGMKSSEPEEGIKEKHYTPQIKESKRSKHSKEWNEHRPEPDYTKNTLLVLENEKAEKGNCLPKRVKENDTVEVGKEDLNVQETVKKHIENKEQQCCTESENRLDSEINSNVDEVCSGLSVLRDEHEIIGKVSNCEREIEGDAKIPSTITEEDGQGKDEDALQQDKRGR